MRFVGYIEEGNAACRAASHVALTHSVRMYRATPRDGIAFVTGASSGIGRATVLELVRRGWCVAITARRHGALKELAAMAPEQIFAYPGDVTRRAQIKAIIAVIEADLGPLALAFLNTGAFLPAERSGFDPTVIAETHAINVGGTVNCLEPILAAMKARGRGQIALNASLAAYNGLPGSLAYGSSKAALLYMAETLRLEYEGTGINIQVVCPGFVRTPMTDQETVFNMPFLMEPEDAARRICDGFERGGFEITFPFRLAALTKFAHALPYPLRFRLLAWSLQRARRR
jgi:NAD(P)-dependent dehydrogenase (short-subunit alcohol dehydrogenase family)